MVSNDLTKFTFGVYDFFVNTCPWGNHFYVSPAKCRPIMISSFVAAYRY